MLLGSSWAAKGNDGVGGVILVDAERYNVTFVDGRNSRKLLLAYFPLTSIPPGIRVRVLAAVEDKSITLWQEPHRTRDGNILKVWVLIAEL
jgi:hypothetical protein